MHAASLPSPPHLASLTRTSHLARQVAAEQPRQFRARQLDIHRPMDVIRDESLLDSEVARDVTHGHQSLDADNEKPKMVHVHADGKKTKEIPTPITLDVDSYQTDYLPSFLPRHTYIRSANMTDASYVEYDLDHADLDWLNKTMNNDGQERLPPERWVLDSTLNSTDVRPLIARPDSLTRATRFARSPGSSRRCTGSRCSTRASWMPSFKAPASDGARQRAGAPII